MIWRDEENRRVNFVNGRRRVLLQPCPRSTMFVERIWGDDVKASTDQADEGNESLTL